MLIQVGTIAYKDKQANNFATSTSLYVEHSFDIAKHQNEFMNDVKEMFISDLLTFVKN